MIDDLPFVQEIRANPQDDVPRLIYADYLEEAGDPRGEFVRVQCELTRLEPGDPARSDLDVRERELLETYAEEWLEPLRALGVEGVSARCFQRGLIERARIPAATFLKNGEELCRIAPALHCLDLRRPQEVLRDLATATIPAQISQLDLSANRLAVGELGVLKQAPWVQNLTLLNLQFNQLRDYGIQELVSVPWPRLKHLGLGANGIGPAGADALASWPLLLVDLTTLLLNVNQIGDIGAEALAELDGATSLEHLDLASNGIGSRGAVAISRSESLATLKHLNLRANRIGAEGYRALSHSDTLSLESLDVRNNGMEPTTV